MKRTLVAIAISLACGAVFAQAAGSSIPADQQQAQKNKEDLRAERERLKREARENKRKIKEERREERKRAKEAAAKG